MGKGFGIAGLVLAILAIFVPVAGVFLSAVAVLLAIIAGLSGDRAFSVATALIAGVDTFFLSPSLWMMQMGGPDQSRNNFMVATIALAFTVAPIVCAFIGSKRKATA